MRIKSTGPALLIAALLLSLSLPALGADTFTYNPPDGTRYLLTVKNTSTYAADSKTIMQGVGLARSRFSIQKTGSGWTAVKIPISLSMKVDNKNFNDPSSKILEGIIVTYDILPGGALAVIKGYENLDEKISETYTGDLAESVSAVISREIMEQTERLEWEKRITSFAGKNAQPGTTDIKMDSFNTPDGKKIEYFNAYKIADSNEYPEPGLVRIDFCFSTDKRDIAEFFGRSVDDVFGAGTPFSDFSEITLEDFEGSGYRIIDPGTMMIYHEYTKIETKIMMMLSPKVTKAVDMRREVEYSFEYK